MNAGWQFSEPGCHRGWSGSVVFSRSRVGTHIPNASRSPEKGRIRNSALVPVRFLAFQRHFFRWSVAWSNLIVDPSSKGFEHMIRHRGFSFVLLISIVLIASLGAAKPAADDRVIPVTVTGKVESAVVKQGEPIPLSVTISNGLKGSIGYSTYSLKPNDWNGETVSLTLVDIYRNGKPVALFLDRPKVERPIEIAGMSRRRIKPGGSLTIGTDAGKWKVIGGWVPGKYKVNVRVERMSVDGGRCILSVHSGPFEFEIR